MLEEDGKQLKEACSRRRTSITVLRNHQFLTYFFDWAPFFSIMQSKQIPSRILKDRYLYAREREREQPKKIHSTIFLCDIIC